MGEVKAALEGVNLKENNWEEGDDGKELVATARHYQLRFFFSGDAVLTTSVQVLSD